MLFEDMQVADAGLDELRPDQLSAVVPALAIGGEDAVAISLIPNCIQYQAHHYESPKNSCQSSWKGFPLP